MKFLPFWIFIFFFKFAGNIHYDLISPFGDKFLPLWIVGLIMGGASILQVILDVPAGHLMDRYGYKKLLIITTVIFMAASLFYVSGLTLVSYVLSVFIAAVGWLFFGPGINAYSLSHATRGTAGRFLSKKDIAGSAGVVVCAVLLPFVLVLTPEYVGYLLLIFFAASLVSLLFAPKDIERIHNVEKIPAQHYHVRRSFIGDTLKALKRLNPASGMLLFSNVVASTFYGSVWFVVPLVLSKQVNNQVLSLGLGIFDFAIIVLGYILGNIADKFNKKRLVFIGLLVFSFSAMLSGLNFDWLFLLFGFLATSGDEMTQLSLWSWLHTLDKDHANDGAVSGVVNFFNDAGWAIGPILAGILYGIVGPGWTIMISALPIFLVWVAYQFVMHRHVHHYVPADELPLRPHRHRHKG